MSGAHRRRDAFAKGSIQSSLLRVLAITTGGALALVATLLVVTELFNHRRTTESNLHALTSVIALYSEAALEFGDRAAGSEALAALQSIPQVEAAILYDVDGKTFATFGSGAVENLASDVQLAPGVRYGTLHMDLVRAISHNGQPAGYLWVRRSTTDLVHDLVSKFVALGVALIGALLLAIALASRLGRHIARPLAAQVEACAAVADGDLSVQVPDEATGELGELARAFNTMTAGLRALISQVGQGVDEVVTVSRTLEERGGHLGHAAAAQAAAIGEATESVERVGTSIRSVNHSVEQIAESAAQSSDFAVEMDGSIGQVAARMGELTQAIAATSAAVTQVTASIRRIARGAETLQQATTGTALHLDGLTRTVSTVAAKATESSSLSQDSSRAANEGMIVVREASAAMNAIATGFHSLQEGVARLSQRSTSIDEIVQVITEIADETKLLALNASIIAAQAGDGGKAFDVVARQVGALAERTRGSANDITELIRATQNDTSAAVMAVEEGSARIAEGVQRSAASGQVLERILATSTSSATRTLEIAEATARQAADLDRVGIAFREIDEAVEAIRDSTREQEQSSEEIARQIEHIRDLGTAVREATEGQRRGSSLVSKAATQMSEMLTQIVGETSAQSQSGATIEQTLRVFRDVSTETVRSAEAITAAVATLQKRAEWLAEESRRFRTSADDRSS
jgi:methyl-accepting chemotaxis protein